jgi:hypothetical protein
LSGCWSGKKKKEERRRKKKNGEEERKRGCATIEKRVTAGGCALEV